MKTTIVYAINNSPKHFFMLQKSIKSLRKYNSETPIKVYSATTITDFEKQALDMVGLAGNVEMVHTPEWRDRSDPTILKWFAVSTAAMTAERVVFLDADTYFLEDIEDMLACYTKLDFYAREEVGTEKDGKHRMVGSTLIQHQLDRVLFEKICIELRSEPAFVPNTGIMIFNNDSAKRMDPRLVEFYASKFKSRDYAYPSSNKHIVEEIAAAIMIGKSGSSMATLKVLDAPFYIEHLRETTEGDPYGWEPVVIHSWSGYYPFMLRDLEGLAEAKKVPGAELYDFGEK